MSAQGVSKYDMRQNPVYQVDCQIAASGKVVAASKRRIRWRFGFSHRESLDKGLTGADCRGEEHEVVLVWSLASGKQLILADGLEVHFASARLADKFEKTWTMSGGHVIKVVAYAAPPLFAVEGFRQFDLQIDGLSYWDMPKMHELGKRSKSKSMRELRSRSSPAYGNYERSQSAHFSRRASHHDFNVSYTSPSPEERHHEVSVRRVHSMSNMNPTVDLISEPAIVKDYLLPSPTSVVDEFTPVQPVATPLVQPTFQDKANQIMNSYAPVAVPAHSNPAIANESHTQYPTVNTYYTAAPQHPHVMTTPDSSYAAPAQNFTYNRESPQSSYSGGPASGQSFTSNRDSPQSVDVSYGTAPSFVELHSPQEAVVPSMEPLDIATMDDEPAASPMEKAIKDLVNFENLAESRETPEQKKTTERREAGKPISGKPKPPTAPEWHLGRNASLADIKAHAPQKEEAKKEIMRTHAFDPAAAQAGMMVVYGATGVQQQYGGIPAVHGFGAGARVCVGH